MKRVIYSCLVLVFSLCGSIDAQEDHLPSLSLDEVWDLVIENHEEVKSLCLDNYQAKLNVRQTLQRLLPAVGASASITYSNPSKDVDGSRIVPTSFRAGSLTVNQSILDFRVRPSLLGVKYAKEATLHQSEFELYEILYIASETFLAVLQSKELLLVSGNQLALAEEQYSVARERYESGEVPVSDLLRSEEEVNRAKRVLRDVLSDVQIYEAHLSNLIGVETCGYRLISPAYLEFQEKQNLDNLIAEACNRREDLKSIAASIEAAKQFVRVMKRTNYPKLDFLGEYTIASPETLTFRNNSWSAALWVNMPLFDGGVNRTQVKSAEAELTKQQLLYARMKKDLKVKVKTAYYELISAETNFTLLENELAIAKQNYALLSERYKKGQTTNIDLMDALNSYIQAQANHANVQYNLILLTLKLKKETGFFEECLQHGLQHKGFL